LVEAISIEEKTDKADPSYLIEDLSALDAAYTQRYKEAEIVLKRAMTMKEKVEAHRMQNSAP